MSTLVRQLEEEIAVIDAGLEKLPPSGPAAQKGASSFRGRRARLKKTYVTNIATRAQANATTNRVAAVTATRSIDQGWPPPLTKWKCRDRFSSR